jgi:hypothetical protein
MQPAAGPCTGFSPRITLQDYRQGVKNMARIRSIHPNTLIDPEFASVPVEARLLFIYSWTTADDAGNLEGNPLGLRMALFPADEWATVARITELAEMLIAGRFYESYEADGKQYLHIRNFPKYQKLDHPAAPKFPLAPGQSYTYHARQGNTFVPRTENGPPLIPRTTPEQHTNVSVTLVCRSRRTGLDRTGLERKGKDLDGNGTERREPGRGGKRATASAGALRPPLAAPLQQGADRGKGTPTASGNMSEATAGGNGDFLAFTDSLSNLKREALQHAINLSHRGEWSEDAVEAHLKAAGFAGPELSRAQALSRAGERAAN